MRNAIMLLFVAAIGCLNTENQKKIEVENVNEVLLQLIAADNRSDIAAVLGSYTNDVEFYPKDKPVLRGIDKVEANYKTLFKDNQLSLNTTILSTQIFGDSAVVKGINTGTRSNLVDSIVYAINDRYEAHLSRDDKGSWKISKLYWSPIDSIPKP